VYEIEKEFQPQITPNITKLCNEGDTDGAISISVFGGDTGLSFEWSDQSNFSNIIATTKDISDLGAGTYYLRITNQSGCIYTESFEISMVYLEVYMDSNAESIFANIETSENLNESVYSWSRTSDFSSTITSETQKDGLLSIIENLGSGTYYFKVVLSNGCEKVFEYNI